MSNPEAFAMSQMPALPDEEHIDYGDEMTDGTFPTDTQQPETQGDDPLDAELGEDGQGDLAPEDEGGQHSGDAPADLRDGTE